MWDKWLSLTISNILLLFLSATTSASSSSSLSPFVTAVCWCPQPLCSDLLSHDPTSSSSHLLLAAGDRQGRIYLLDLRVKSSSMFLQTDSKLGIQDLCWIQTQLDTWIIVALSRPSLLSLYNISTGKCFFKYDATPEIFSYIRCDPFDSRHFCALGLKGFLLSIKVIGDNFENDVVIKERQIPTDTTELLLLERDVVGATTGAGASNLLPASASFPIYIGKLAVSPHWKHILFVRFLRELIVFDLKYETTLSSARLPRACRRFLDMLPDPSLELLYYAHLDGKLSTWRRKE